MKTIQDTGQRAGVRAGAKDEWGRSPMAPERYKSAAETIKGMLSECEDCMGEGLLGQAAALSEASFLMAQRHGCEKLQEDAAIRFIVLNIAMDRPEELERAIACGWVQAEDIEYISGLFAEAERAKPQDPGMEIQRGRPGEGRSITEMKNDILSLLEGFKAKQGQIEDPGYFSFSEDEL